MKEIDEFIRKTAALAAENQKQLYIQKLQNEREEASNVIKTEQSIQEFIQNSQNIQLQQQATPQTSF